jgi:TatA/E family protein of Tat protein translocase
MSIGPLQILVIIALIVLLLWIPKRVPGIIEDLGKSVRSFKSAAKEVKEVSNEIDKEVNEIKEDLKL